MTGNVFLVSSYDNTFESGSVSLQSEQCAQCGFVGTSGILKRLKYVSPVRGMQFIPLRPMSQQPITTEYPKGGISPRSRISLRAS